MDLRKLIPNKDLMEDGIAIPFPFGDNDASITIRPDNYKPFNDWRNQQLADTKKNRRTTSRRDSKSAALYRKVTIEGLARFIWVSHEGIDFDGAPLSNDFEVKRDLLDQAPDLLEWLETEASDMSNFELEALAEDAEATKKLVKVAAPVRPTNPGPPKVKKRK